MPLLQVSGTTRELVLSALDDLACRDPAAPSRSSVVARVHATRHPRFYQLYSRPYPENLSSLSRFPEESEINRWRCTFQITSAIVHPHCVYLEQSEGLLVSAGSIIGERLPEEDVRVVETADSSHQQDAPVLPGAQRRKLYFNPAYFDRQLLLVSRW